MCGKTRAGAVEVSPVLHPSPRFVCGATIPVGVHEISLCDVWVRDVRAPCDNCCCLLLWHYDNKREQ